MSHPNAGATTAMLGDVGDASAFGVSEEADFTEFAIQMITISL
jgi:hypothetical protein